MDVGAFLTNLLSFTCNNFVKHTRTFTRLRYKYPTYYEFNPNLNFSSSRYDACKHIKHDMTTDLTTRVSSSKFSSISNCQYLIGSHEHTYIFMCDMSSKMGLSLFPN